jgi:hypothetical protein
MSRFTRCSIIHTDLYQNDILKTVRIRISILASDDAFALACTSHNTHYLSSYPGNCKKLELGIDSISEISSHRILWAFYISPVKDRNGADALPAIDNFLGGLVVRPAPFVYYLTPRKEGTRTIILEEWAKAEEEAAMWL